MLSSPASLRSQCLLLTWFLPLLTPQALCFKGICAMAVESYSLLGAEEERGVTWESALIIWFSFLIYHAYSFKHAFHRLMKQNSQKDKHQKLSDGCLNLSHTRHKNFCSRCFKQMCHLIIREYSNWARWRPSFCAERYLIHKPQIFLWWLLPTGGSLKLIASSHVSPLSRLGGYVFGCFLSQLWDGNCAERNISSAPTESFSCRFFISAFPTYLKSAFIVQLLKPAG